MAKYRKLPIVIEAIQITKELVHGWATGVIPKPKEITALDVWWNGTIDINDAMSTYSGKVRTPEGDMPFKLGDWLITGIANEKYSCKDGIFQATYEPT